MRRCQSIVGYADVKHSYIQSLPEIVRRSHQLPEDVMENASIVLCCFIPFTKKVALSNKNTDQLASAEWAQAYEITNGMFPELSNMVIELLKSMLTHSRYFSCELVSIKWLCAFRHL